jgi:hypothetical protein
MSIPNGKYAARATSGALATAKTGTPQVGVEFQITQGEHAGQCMTWYGFFTDLTTDRTIESLRHCGWQGDDLSDLRGIDANEVQIVIDEEQDKEGNFRQRIRWVNAMGGLALQGRMDEQSAKAFAASMRARAAAIRPGGAKPAAKPGTNGAARPSSSRSSPPPHTDADRRGAPGDDDIPF